MSDLLDLRAGVGQVALRYDFDLLTPNLQPIGRIFPVADSITNDATATIKRALRGFTLTANDARDVNPAVDRVRVSMVLEDGTRRPMGVFMFTNTTTRDTASHTFYDATLVDQGLRINQQLRWPYAVPRYADLTQALIRITEQVGIFDYDFQLPVASCGTDIGWPTKTLALDVMTQIVNLAGAVGPYFDNEGRLIARLPTPLSADVAIDYEPGRHSRIVQDTLHTSKRYIDAPNVYVVESADLDTTAITATAFIDPRLEHSVERIGYERPDVRQEQGLVDTDHALRMVRNLAETDPRQLDKADFTTSPNPVHDTYDVVMVDGVLYREQTWTQSLTAPTMTHTVTQQAGDLKIGVAI
jgi:hypothetical protein